MVERGVVARGEAAGKYQTEVIQTAYLKEGIPMKGKGGVWKVEINKNLLPDCWISSTIT
jgi:hypothetical protein